MNTMRRAAWPLTTILLAVTWVMFPPAGWLWSRARRNARRHRQLLAATRQAGQRAGAEMARVIAQRDRAIQQLGLAERYPPTEIG